MLSHTLRRWSALAEGGLPWILPVVLYNGERRWTVPGERSALAALPSPRAERALAAFQQRRAYALVSLERMLAEAAPGLANWPRDNRVLATFRLQIAPTPAALLQQLEREYANFPGPGDVDTRRVLHAWAGALLADMAGGEAPLPAFAETEELEGARMTTISQARLGKWFEDFLAKGVEQGIEQGKAQGVKDSAARLLRQAEIKFGDLLGETPTTLQLDRVGDWLIECGSGAELLSQAATLRVPSTS